MKLLKTLVVSLALAVPLVASAQSTPRFDQRQGNQAQRIEQGTQSGALTARETVRLERGQTHLQAREDKAKADGVVSKGERVGLQRAENKQSARIYRQKHDPQHDLNHNGKVDHPRRARS